MNYIEAFLSENNLRMGETFFVDGINGTYRFTATGLEVTSDSDEHAKWGIARNVFMKLMSGELKVGTIKFPMMNQYYYYVNHKGKVGKKIYKRDYIDVALIHFGNIFPSEFVARENRNSILGEIRKFECYYCE